MCTCEFCNTEFEPRPQVKNPRACSNCQNARQRANEKEWRNRHLGLYDGKYHQVKRESRNAAIKTKVKDPQFIGSLKFALGIVLVPVFYVLQTTICYVISGSILISAIYFLSLPLSVKLKD